MTCRELHEKATADARDVSGKEILRLMMGLEAKVFALEQANEARKSAIDAVKRRLDIRESEAIGHRERINALEAATRKKAR